MVVRVPVIFTNGSYEGLPPGDTVPGTDPTALASGNAGLSLASTALASGNAGLSLASTALASGNAALTSASTALASGNAGRSLASTALASGNAGRSLAVSALASGNAALTSASTALASGNAGLSLAVSALASGNAGRSLAVSALASGNAALTSASTALSSGNAGLSLAVSALSSGNAGLSLANNALPKAGGTLTGNVTLSNQTDLRFGEASVNGANYVGFQAPASIAADLLWTLPSTDAAVAGYVLSSNAAATLSWVAAGGTPLFPSTTVTVFQQTNAPTGWTKQLTHDNKALRVVTGTVSNGGSLGFTTAFTSRTPAGTVGATTLTTAQLPSHNHSIQATSGANATGSSKFNPPVIGNVGGTSGATGGGDSHTHGFTGSSLDFSVAYVDLILAAKD